MVINTKETTSLYSSIVIKNRNGILQGEQNLYASEMVLGVEPLLFILSFP